MNPIDLNSARQQQWDVVICGTSFAAMFFARELAPTTRVLFIEKGQRISHADRLARQPDAGPGPGKETISHNNSSKHEKEWVAHSTFGGNSNCWWACTPRFHPSDFRLNSLYGVGLDWPINYDDLEEIYCDVEDAMDISGGGSDHMLPRSRPFPSPEMRPSRSDIALRAHSPNWWAQPTARSNSNRRPRCCGNGVCHLCPIDSKFTITNSLDLFERPNFHLLLDTEVREIARQSGTATHLAVRHLDGTEAQIPADLFALATNALFNAAIMLRSGFQNPALGGYIHEQASQTLLIDTAIENFHGQTSISGHNYDLYDGDHRATSGGILIENWNAPPVLRTEKGKWTQRLAWKLIAEDLPSANNRVVLKDNEPQIEWTGHDPYAERGLERARSLIETLLPTPIENIIFNPNQTTEAHIQGTHRMGTTADTGVTDAGLKTFECRNVLALGAGAFPTCSPANPTLTLSALSVHAARSL